MGDGMASGLARARRAKEHAKELLGGRADLAGIGISRVGAGWAVKVNLSRADAEAAAIPAEIDGVPVVVAVVGRVRRL